MKKIISAIFAVAMLATVARAQTATVFLPSDTAHAAAAQAEASATYTPAPNVSAEEADQKAQEGKYSEAIDAYEAILHRGEESANLYYNLGYSYFKYGELGKAILNFERAKRLNPSDADVASNLETAYLLTDKMEEVEAPVFDRMCSSVASLFGSDGWAWAFVMLFFLTIAGVACFLFLDSVQMRKTGFFSAIVFFILSVTSLCISLSKRADAINGEVAIIMSDSADLATSPDKNATRMTVLHEGTRVVIIDTLGDWIEVKLKDGNVGWMKSSDVERV